jgi:hypothetical protein
MARLRTFLFFTAAQQSWTIDRDCSLVGMTATGTSIVSTDPNIDYNYINNPTSDTQLDNWWGYTGSVTLPIAIDLKKGTKLFVSPNGAGIVVQLWFR